MKNLKLAAVTLAITILMCGSALAQSFQFIGSYAVSDGPDWTTNPPVYSAQEAAALLFGGSASDYAISTNSNTSDPGTITHTGNYDGWGAACQVRPEGFKLDVAPPGYADPGGADTSFSAYVSDHGCDQINYVWRVAGSAAVPTLSEWGLVALTALLALFGVVSVRRRLA